MFLLICLAVPALTNGVTKEDEDAAGTEHFIKCPQCQKGCSSFQSLKEHIECCHPHAIPEEGSTASLPPASAVASPPPAAVGTGGPYGCSQCTTSFSTKDQLEKHELLHSPNAQVVSTIIVFLYYVRLMIAWCVVLVIAAYLSS